MQHAIVDAGSTLHLKVSTAEGVRAYVVGQHGQRGSMHVYLRGVTALQPGVDIRSRIARLHLMN